MNIRNAYLENNTTLQSRQTNGNTGLNAANDSRIGISGTNRTDSFVLSIGTRNNQAGNAASIRTQAGTAQGTLPAAGIAASTTTERTGGAAAGLNANTTNAASNKQGTGLITGTALMYNRGLGGTAQGGVLAATGLMSQNTAAKQTVADMGVNMLTGGLRDTANLNRVTGNQNMAAGPLGTVGTARNAAIQTRNLINATEVTTTGMTMTAKRTQYENTRPQAVELAGQTANTTIETEPNPRQNQMTTTAVRANTGNGEPGGAPETVVEPQNTTNAEGNNRNTAAGNSTRNTTEVVPTNDIATRATATNVTNENAVKVLQRQVERAMTQAQTQQNPFLDLIA